MGAVTLTKGSAGKIAVTFPYSPDFVATVKCIPGHRWHRENKSWSFSHTDEIIEKSLKVFEGEEIRIDPALKSFIPNKQHAPHVAAREITVSRSSPQAEARVAKNLEDLRREMMLHIKGAKGRKDRYTMLSETALEILAHTEA
ncbi:hypothetical protein D4S03_02895 [bacterium]|nr:MAG: hypothetical protein D4S03_02895 [bacterium]